MGNYIARFSENVYSINNDSANDPPGLVAAREAMQEREQNLERRIATLQVQAQRHLKNRDRESARKLMTHKKRLETQLRRLQSQMVNTDLMISRFEENCLNVAVIDAQASTERSIRSVYRGLTAERVDASMSRIQEVMDESTDISQAMSAPIVSTALSMDDEEEELERELERLMQEEEEEGKEEQDVLVPEREIPAATMRHSTPKRRRPELSEEERVEQSREEETDTKDVEEEEEEADTEVETESAIELKSIESAVHNSEPPSKRPRREEEVQQTLNEM